MKTGSRAVPAKVAAAIGEPARARMLYCLMDGRARTGTELAIVGGVGAPTASVHLARLTAVGLVQVAVQGRHRYYRLAGHDAAGILESLSAFAGGSSTPIVRAPQDLRAARTCYDHLAGVLGVALYRRLLAKGWLIPPSGPGKLCGITAAGESGLNRLGVDLAAARSRRRRLAVTCLDWTERRPHLGGALGTALLDLAIAKNWIVRETGSRAVRLTRRGQRALEINFGVNQVAVVAGRIARGLPR